MFQALQFSFIVDILAFWAWRLSGQLLQKLGISSNFLVTLKATNSSFTLATLVCENISDIGYCPPYKSFTLATFVSITVSYSETRQLCDCTCLGHLGRHDINRNYPISVALHKMAKASTSVSLACVIVASIIVPPSPM